MSEIGKKISECQNSNKNIEKLAAQRELYSIAKNYFILQVILNVVFTIILSVVNILLKQYCHKDIESVRALYAILVILLDYLWINNLVNDYKQRAASIQEKFDCDVLKINWNKIHVGDEPTFEETHRYYKEYYKKNNDLNTFNDWYSESIKEINSNAAKIICQRSNVHYDSAVRKRFIIYLIIIPITIGVLISFTSLIYDASFKSFLSLGLLPMAPLLTFILKIYNEHRSSLKTLKSLKSSINSAWSNILRGKEVDEETIRQVQDKIYTNRKSNPLIPDWIYFQRRPALEEELNYSVGQLVDEYKNRKLTE